MRQECDGCFSNESYWLHQMIASKQCYFSIRQSNETIVAFGWREWAKKKYKEATISSNVPAAKQTSNIRNEKAASHFCEWMKRRYLWFMEYISNWSSSPQTHTHTQCEWNAVYLLYAAVVWKVRTDYYLGLGFDMMCVWIILFDILLRDIINVAYTGWRCHQFTKCCHFVGQWTWND